MKISKSFILFQFVTILLLQQQMNAWWDVGHMLVSQIAEQELKQKNTTIYNRVKELIDNMNPLCIYPYSFTEAAVWPDDIKTTAMNFWNNWHFYDSPVNPEHFLLNQDPIIFKENAINCINRASSILSKDDGTNTMEKSIFIRYVLHVIGDIHQPLHAACLYNSTYKTGDVGGNFEKVYDLNGRYLVFHAYWDQGAQYLQDPDFPILTRPLNQTGLNYLENWASELRTQYSRESLSDELTKKYINEWTSESYNEAMNFVYPFIQNTNQITADYQTKSQKLVQKRIILAGYRLCDYLLYVYENYNPKQKEEVETNLYEILNPHNWKESKQADKQFEVNDLFLSD